MFGAHVFVDRSQFPDAVRHELLACLRTRTINPKFHYESCKQAAKWLSLHESYSPARSDPSCVRIYGRAFQAAFCLVKGKRVHVVALGCGGGMKEARLLRLLCEQNCEVAYTPVDVSLPLVLTARKAALRFLPGEDCGAVVCDLGKDNDLVKQVLATTAEVDRLFTLFGLIPNFEPTPLLSQIKRLLSPSDLLLLSANLAPGTDYETGVRAVLPQYDNALTRDWLMTLLLDLGFERDDGKMTFRVETSRRKLFRIVADFEVRRPRTIRAFGESFSYRDGEHIRLFYSYRHTPMTLSGLLGEHDIEVVNCWLNKSGEEGVFLCRKNRRHSHTGAERHSRPQSGVRRIKKR